MAIDYGRTSVDTKFSTGMDATVYFVPQESLLSVRKDLEKVKKSQSEAKTQPPPKQTS